jgi:hypothetical protein
MTEDSHQKKRIVFYVGFMLAILIENGGAFAPSYHVPGPYSVVQNRRAFRHLSHNVPGHAFVSLRAEGDAGSKMNDSPRKGEARNGRTTSRLGGRARSAVSREPESKNDGWVLSSWWKKSMVFLLGTWAILQLLGYVLFGGGGNGVYFYESSVYETSTMDSDGKVQTERKTSVRSNYPGNLVSGQQQQQEKGVMTEEKSKIQTFVEEQNRMEEEFGRAFESDVARLTRSIMDDYYLE